MCHRDDGKVEARSSVDLQEYLDRDQQYGCVHCCLFDEQKWQPNQVRGTITMRFQECWQSLVLVGQDRQLFHPTRYQSQDEYRSD